MQSGPSSNERERDHKKTTRATTLQRVAAVALGGALASVLMAAAAVRTYPPVTTLFGGAGGSEAAIGCPLGRIVGADVTSHGAVVSGIRLVCEKPARDSGQLGSMTGAKTELRCPPGSYAIGIWGAVGGLVDAFSLSCAATPTGPVRHLEPAGGPGGFGFHARCEGFLAGLRARHGVLVDAIGPSCARQP